MRHSIQYGLARAAKAVDDFLVAIVSVFPDITSRRHCLCTHREWRLHGNQCGRQMNRDMAIGRHRLPEFSGIADIDDVNLSARIDVCCLVGQDIPSLTRFGGVRGADGKRATAFRHLYVTSIRSVKIAVLPIKMPYGLHNKVILVPVECRS